MELINHMEAVEELLKNIKSSTLSEKVIEDIKRSIKELSDISKTFENYQNIVNYDIKLRQVADYLINESLIISQESENPDISNDQQLFCTSLNYLKLLVNEIAYQKRIDIIQDVLNSSCKKEILFNNARSADEVNKRYRNLSLNFHPDKTNRPNTPCSLQGEHKNLGIELFRYITEIKNSLLTNYEEILSNEGWTFHKKNADEFWKITIDYRNAAKGQWDKLKLLKKDEICKFSSEELERSSVNYGLLAYQEYRMACKIVDKAKQLKEQVRLRGNIALCLYVSNRLLEAQLYALSAIKLQFKNSHEVKLHDLNEAKKIFDKVRGRNTYEEIPELRTEIKLKVNSENTRALVRLLDQGISFSDKKSYQRSIDNDMLKISTDLMLKADRSLVRYQIPKDEILHVKYQSTKLKTVGGLITTTGVGVGLSVTAAAGVKVSTAILLGVSTVGGPIGLVIGIITFGLGIWAGSKLWKSGNNLSNVPTILENINNIMKRALKAYDDGDHQQFINELSEEYKTGTSLIRLVERSDVINPKEIIDTLLSYGFRPDGIAYLLILLGEVLSSGKLKIEGKTTGELVSLAKDVLSGMSSKKLEEMAIKLDERICELRKKNNLLKIFLNRFTDFVTLKEYSNIAKEHIDDAQKMPFLSRLEEMRNIADINLAIFDIINSGEEEIQRAKKTIEKIRDKNDRYSFAELRLEVLEDFLSVVCGVESPQEFPQDSFKLPKITFPMESEVQ
ncbi:15297_t:CDS:1 [Funneliformis mosseae]|uniref:15297_t:CDS:1 n=1 Tax=Funneliformis mosseae TaxID=27381 RepID=A0A9N9D212_FUNMO|nr:15297_t:CDS:1 [Funneliformis mosseae]